MTSNDQVGREFELEVLKALKEGLSKRLFGLDPKYWTVFHGKKYFSRDRSSPIEVDISIEYRMPNATDPSILWIWECKALSRPVDVPELEKFHAQLDQIGADNTKGTVIARGRFTEAAIQYATAKRIGLIRKFPNEMVHIASYGFPPNELVAWAEAHVQSILSDEEEGLVKLINLSSRTIFGITPYRITISGTTGDLSQYIGHCCLGEYFERTYGLPGRRSWIQWWRFALERVRAPIASLFRISPG